MRTTRFMLATALLASAASVPTTAAFSQTPSAGAITPSLTLKAAKAQYRPVRFEPAMPAASGTLVLPLTAEGDLATRASALSDAERSAIQRALASAEFDYANPGSLTLRGIGNWDRIHVVGTGKDLSMYGFEDYTRIKHVMSAF